MAKTTMLRLGVLMFLCECVTSLIVPEEVPTVLSLIYANIPPVKKGTDSRFGVGFRLGEHADFQVLVELGPQTNTDPIGNTDSKRRRQATMVAAMRGELGPWAQAVAKYQTRLRIQKELEDMKRLEDKLKKLNQEESQSEQNSNGGEWLKNWSKGMVQVPEEQSPSENLPIQVIIPNMSDNKVISLVNMESEMGNEMTGKMTQLKKLYIPQPSVQSV